MDMNYYKQYEPIFGSWKIVRKLGEGSFGKVFEIEREDFGTTYKAALKAITVPASETELRDVMADGMDEAAAREYYYSFVQDLVKEFALMSRLKGNSNIVSYENHQVIEHKDGIGWDILIQMELLTPLNEYTRKNTVTRQDIIRLGIDMCKALELCQKFNIIHRDVKPENIFVSESGDFKLGDFGIARTVEKTTSGLSKKGTYTYMAPEVYKGENYDTTVDIYSLGVVLYRLLNENRTPFLPAYPAPITHSDRENALAKRFSGAPLPQPIHAEGRLGEIVLKACAYDPAQRYNVPLRMRQELEAILYNREESRYIYPDGDEAPQKSIQYIATGDEPPVSVHEATQKDDGPALPVQDRTVSQFDGTVGQFDSTASAFDATVGQFDSTVVGSDRTVSDFGRPAPAPKGKKQPAKAKPAPKPAVEKQPAAPKGKKGLIIGAAVGVIAVGVGVGAFLYSRNADQKFVAQMEQEIYSGWYTLGDYGECIEMIEHYTALDGYRGKLFAESTVLQEMLASSYFELGEYANAAQLYARLVEGGSTEVSTLRDYAVSLARQGRLDEAASIVLLLTQQNAQADVTSYVLGQTYYAKGEYENAKKAFADARAAATEADMIRRITNAQAETCRELEDYWGVIDAFLDGKNYSPVMEEMVGFAYYQLSKTEEAAADGKRAEYALAAANAFTTAISDGMQKDYMYINAAAALMDAGEYESAVATLDEMEQVYPNNYMPNALRAIFHIQNENTKAESKRNYTYAAQQYDLAKQKATASDDQTYLQMLESYIQQLKQYGWL